MDAQDLRKHQECGRIEREYGRYGICPSTGSASCCGYPVRGSQGTALTLQTTRPVEIARDGTVTQDGAIIGKLEVVDFTSIAGLSKQGSNYFRADPALKSAPAADASLQQGSLEASNTGSAEAAVRLVSVLRQFEMMQKAVSIGNEMGKRAIEEVAKV